MAATRRRPRRERSLTESLATIVLTLEAILVFFIALTVYGLHAVPPEVAFGGGAALAVVLVLATRVTRYRWGIWLGSILQLVILATGVVLAALYIVAVVFIAMWVYCIVRGVRIDRYNRTLTTPNESTGS